MPVQTLPWGTTRSGKSVSRFVLTNDTEMSAEVISYGAVLSELNVPDKQGCITNVCLGYPDLEEYEKDSFFIGAVVGRFANRIARGEFTLNGKTYKLPINNAPNHLHGGPAGYYKQVWDAEPVEEPGAAGVKLTYLSPDGEAGYPGNLKVQVIYRLMKDNALQIDFQAETDQPTPVNLTSHAYWNLAGKDSILDHVLELHASRYLEVDNTAIPTGRLLPVKDSPFDFTDPKPIGNDLSDVPGGYDHCFVLDGTGESLKPAAVLKDPESGRVMEMFTTKPAVQFYSGNFLEGAFDKHDALCLEAQYYPDSPNQSDFPSCILNPGEIYRHTTVLRFTVEA